MKGDNVAILSLMRSIDISIRVKIFVSVRIREGSDSCRLEVVISDGKTAAEGLPAEGLQRCETFDAKCSHFDQG